MNSTVGSPRGTKTISSQMKDPKMILSTLWIFAMLNYIYNDVFGLFFNPAAQKITLSMGQGPALMFAIFMETAMAMVLLSRLLKYSANRWVNIIAGIFHTALVTWSLTRGSAPAIFRIFCGDRNYHHVMHHRICLEMAQP